MNGTAQPTFASFTSLAVNDSNAKATTGIKRIWASSHNDEMQGQDALVLALSLGYGFIEIDTHLGLAAPSARSLIDQMNNSSRLNSSLTLLAGHTDKDLNYHRTVKQLYFDPLMAVLDRNSAAVNSSLMRDRKWVGLYEDDPDANVGILIDMKNDGDCIWPYLIAELQPFLDKGYLTTYNVSTGIWTRGPLTIIGTGSTPIPRVYYSALRYIFYDAPLLELSEPYTIPTTSFGPSTTFNWDKTISPMASSKFPLLDYLALGPGSDKGGSNPFWCNLKLFSAIARGKGIQSRWWGVARQPRWLRRKMWEVLWKSGAAVINSDDLREFKLWLDTKDDKERGYMGC
nr:uncharacterized protein CI109_006610 [Kwoniella shandongensis]KAA5525059.1 hypothetical protein CI109_006610 [Kwoniella shandongensis]